jgi:hypothetical protein
MRARNLDSVQRAARVATGIHAPIPTAVWGGHASAAQLPPVQGNSAISPAACGLLVSSPCRTKQGRVKDSFSSRMQDGRSCMASALIQIARRENAFGPYEHVMRSRLLLPFDDRRGL